jgi:hypothetical protein
MGFWGGCSASSVQLVTAGTTQVNTYANMITGTTSANRQILALGNSNTYAAGGTIATATGGNALSALISPHEIGHSLGGLQDEYDYLTCGVPGGTYTGGERRRSTTPCARRHDALDADEVVAGRRAERGGRHHRALRGRPEPALRHLAAEQALDHEVAGLLRPADAGDHGAADLGEGRPSSRARRRPNGRTDRVLWIDTLHRCGDLNVSWAVDNACLSRHEQQP